MWALDLDGDNALKWADANVPETSWRVKTPRGEHRYFRMPEDSPLAEYPRSWSNLVPTLEPHAEVAVQGLGECAIVPPSRTNRDAYEWIQPKGARPATWGAGLLVLLKELWALPRPR
ncbi:MAG: bifunctional DNA primase/polymerase [Deltaproteobacteria bacterium]|nr:bifunctional DNA primase/polymerase [Deltaproteobacteria bacterium]